MQTYRFETEIQENGIISIPEIAQFANQQIELVIVIKTEPQQAELRKQQVNLFLHKWVGILKGFDTDELKAQYLREKYG